MASDAQIRANRLNAQKSTGPRTVEGKAVVSQNAVKHGLCARQAMIAGEDVGEYEFYRDRMLAELAPDGAMESMLASRAVDLAWRLQRAERLQNEAFDTLYEKHTTGPLAQLNENLRRWERGPADSGEDGRDLTCGRVVVKDFANTRVLDRLLMYERRLEHSFYRTMAELQRLRLIRQLDSSDEQAVTGSRRDLAATVPNRAEQSQSARSPMKAKLLPGKDVRENVSPAFVSKQTQSNPIALGSAAGQSRSVDPERVTEVGSDGSQPLETPVYSMPTPAGCDAEPSAGAAIVLRKS